MTATTLLAPLPSFPLASTLRALFSPRAQRAFPTVQMRKRQVVTLGKLPGRTVRCTAGTIWLTHDGDAKDVVLCAGETHVCTSSARVLVQALDDGGFSVE